MILDDNASVALQEFKTISVTIEQELLQWLVRYKKMHGQLITIHHRVVLEKEMTKLLKGFKIYFKTHLLKHCIDFEAIFKTHYYDVLNKYEPISQKEREYKIILEGDYMKTSSSLKYHLKKSGMAF